MMTIKPHKKIKIVHNTTINCCCANCKYFIFASNSSSPSFCQHSKFRKKGCRGKFFAPEIPQEVFTEEALNVKSSDYCKNWKLSASYKSF